MKDYMAAKCSKCKRRFGEHSWPKNLCPVFPKPRLFGPGKFTSRSKGGS